METNNNQKSRQEIAEDFILNPNKVLFEMMTEFGDGIAVIQEIFANVDIDSLKVLKGKDGVDGTTPIRGKDYMTKADLRAIQAYVLSLQPKLGVDIATKAQTMAAVKKMVGNIPVPKAKPGKPGAPGKNGSPDTGVQILGKIRKVPKGKGLKISDTEGLVAKLNSLTKLSDKVSAIEKFVQKAGNITMSAPPPGEGTGSGTGDTNNTYSSLGAPQLFNPDGGEVAVDAASLSVSSTNDIGLVTINGQVLHSDEYSLSGSTLTVTPDNGFDATDDEILVFQNTFTPAGLATTADDIEVTDSSKGLILRSPDDTRWRVTVDNTGNLVTTSL